METPLAVESIDWKNQKREKSPEDLTLAELRVLKDLNHNDLLSSP